jgi:cyclic beta-1,2-glucan synthetase
MANAVNSLRLCATLDWPEYVEAVSLVERVLQRDPAGAYGRMDFLSRDAQRRAVEELATPSGEGQVRVALKAIETARQAAAATSNADRTAHVGYHLVGSGRRDLEAELAYRPGAVKRAQGALVRHATVLYLGAIAVLAGLLVAAAVAYAGYMGAHRRSSRSPCSSLLPASDPRLRASSASRSSSSLKTDAPPRFSAGVPETARTMVIVPDDADDRTAWTCSSNMSRCWPWATAIRSSTSRS